MSANTCEILVGRLMEIRVTDGYRVVEDVDEMIAMIANRVSALPPHEKYVIAADWRNVTVMSQETAARARMMLSKSNARVLRSSILTRAMRSTSNLQVERLVREAENENRRHFVNPRDQYNWLAEVLTPSESARLAQFLGLADAAGALAARMSSGPPATAPTSGPTPSTSTPVPPPSSRRSIPPRSRG